MHEPKIESPSSMKKEGVERKQTHKREEEGGGEGGDPTD